MDLFPWKNRWIYSHGRRAEKVEEHKRYLNNGGHLNNFFPE